MYLLFIFLSFCFISFSMPFPSQLKRYSWATVQYSDLSGRVQLLTQKLLEQGYVGRRLKLALQNFYSRHHQLVNHYEISMS